jgi:alpha-1,3-glucosyltransferase
MSASHQHPSFDTSSRKNLENAIVAFSILLRALVGFHSHSGQDNYEGSKVAYGGDFEAQRHWMELTWHLPVGEWYWYDLEYWGLDYPPLTAYVSYICGFLSHIVLGPESIELMTSRGLEDPLHKSFMRATVLVLDILVFGMAVWYAMDRFTEEKKEAKLWVFALTMSQPAILLIDHGHFQYNTVALGLSIASFSYMVRPGFRNCIIGSFLFCLALNFKQMTLYYAPAVFCYLLGRCCLSNLRNGILRVLALGATVITTFAVLWAPCIYYGPEGTRYADRLIHILRRIFPFQRGLFEGKVANLWCVLSTKPIRIRDRLDAELQPILALVLTMILITPACLRVFRLGMEAERTLTHDANAIQRHMSLFLWGAMSTALSFFLASFQVHEKSILLALAPCSLLLWQDPAVVDWFSVVSCWTLWPLLQTDRLELPYICCNLLFVALVWSRHVTMGYATLSIFRLAPWLPTLSYAGMVMLHFLQLVIPAPPDLPDIFEVLWSAAGCGMFCIAWCITCIKLYSASSNTITKSKSS